MLTAVKTWVRKLVLNAECKRLNKIDGGKTGDNYRVAYFNNDMSKPFIAREFICHTFLEDRKLMPFWTNLLTGTIVMEIPEGTFFNRGIDARVLEFVYYHEEAHSVYDRGIFKILKNYWNVFKSNFIRGYREAQAKQAGIVLPQPIVLPVVDYRRDAREFRADAYSIAKTNLTKDEYKHIILTINRFTGVIDDESLTDEILEELDTHTDMVFKYAEEFK